MGFILFLYDVIVVGVNNHSFSLNIFSFLQINYCINLILAVMKRSIWPDDTEVCLLLSLLQVIECLTLE